MARDAQPDRFYTADKLGKPCPACRVPVPAVLNEAGFTHHPCCDPACREEMFHAPKPS